MLCFLPFLSRVLRRCFREVRGLLHSLLVVGYCLHTARGFFNWGIVGFFAQLHVMKRSRRDI